MLSSFLNRKLYEERMRIYFLLLLYLKLVDLFKMS